MNDTAGEKYKSDVKFIRYGKVSAKAITRVSMRDARDLVYMHKIPSQDI